MNKPKDATLSDLGRQLSALALSAQLTADSQTRLTNLAARHTNNRIPSVHRVNVGVYLIQQYIGGSVRTLASYVDTSDYITMARVADMLTHTVGRYRLRAPRIPPASEYGFSPAQAQHDLDHEPEFAAVIKKIENHLREIGALADSAKKEVRTNIELAQRVAALEARFAAFEKFFKSV